MSFDFPPKKKTKSSWESGTGVILQDKLQRGPMSHPQPPQRQPTANETQRYANALHNTALVGLVACPVLMLVPPRKLDFYTFGLFGATIYSANFLVRERTGRSIWQQLGFQGQSGNGTALTFATTPTAAVERSISERKAVLSATQRIPQEKSASVTEQLQHQRDAWKAQREKEIKEDVEEGKGFGDMIVDQIWEVWNWGRKKDGDDDE